MLSLPMTLISGLQCALWPSNWLAENEGRLAVSENVAANQRVSRLSAAHLCLMQLAVFAAQHGMHWVNLDLPPTNNSTAGSDAELNRLGFWLGAAAQSNVDQGPDLAPSEADLATARHLGRRIALAAQQFARGRRTEDSSFSSR